MHCFANLGNAARTAHDYVAAHQYYLDGLRLARRLGYRWGEATTQQELGDVVRLQGDPEYARELTERSLTLFREIGDRMREAVSLAYLGRLHIYLGDDVGARAYLERFLHVSEGIDAPVAEDWGSVALAVCHYHVGDMEQALVYARRGVVAARLVGSHVDHADALVVTAQILTALNQLDDAIHTYQQALALCSVDSASEALMARASLAQIATIRGDDTVALAQVEMVMATLAHHPEGCVDQPGAVDLLCYRVLDTLDDPRATDVLQAAQRRLLAYADGLADDTRRSFLVNVTAHGELQQAYADHFKSTCTSIRSTESESASLE